MLCHITGFQNYSVMVYLIKISIYLTDTLSDEFDNVLNNNGNGFAALRQEVKYSCEKPVQVIIGNPPSTIVTNSLSPRDNINKLLDEFRPPKKQ